MADFQEQRGQDRYSFVKERCHHRNRGYSGARITGADQMPLHVIPRCTAHNQHMNKERDDTRTILFRRPGHVCKKQRVRQDFFLHLNLCPDQELLTWTLLSLSL